MSKKSTKSASIVALLNAIVDMQGEEQKAALEVTDILLNRGFTYNPEKNRFYGGGGSIANCSTYTVSMPMYEKEYDLSFVRVSHYAIHEAGEPWDYEINETRGIEVGKLAEYLDNSK